MWTFAIRVRKSVVLALTVVGVSTFIGSAQPPVGFDFNDDGVNDYPVSITGGYPTATFSGAAAPATQPASMIAVAKRIQDVEQDRVSALLEATVYGTVQMGGDSMQVKEWRHQLLNLTDPIVLAESAHPSLVKDICHREGIDTTFAANLIIDICQVIDQAAKTAVRPDRPFTLNVRPPTETMLPPGVSPSEIEDMQHRQRYLDEIAANRDRQHLGQRASQLDTASRVYAEQATRVFSQLIPKLSDPERVLLHSRIQETGLHNFDGVLELFQNP